MYIHHEHENQHQIAWNECLQDHRRLAGAWAVEHQSLDRLDYRTIVFVHHRLWD